MTKDLIAEINQRLQKSLAKDPSVLTCIVTGRTRPTNAQYLEEKAKKAGSKEEFLAHYICRDAMKLLNTGMSLEDVRKELNVNPQWDIPTSTRLEKAMEINGK